ncbi:hypothetical protein TIFTF001_040017 [Ficus carica]|uniref:Uncharacterized protein n=1 Tax=Ficus carica TaxID=3494 RepID=A0AA87ZAK9_FICCA|nr:hypothetical protein TIFTF001_040017 [Ficus carica]
MSRNGSGTIYGEIEDGTQILEMEEDVNSFTTTRKRDSALEELANTAQSLRLAR